ncbi:MAG: response regulator [bacterium]|jgi:CheY-like chemotaxis protein
MSYFLVAVIFVVFVLLDLGIRHLLKHREIARLARERREALDIGLKLEISKDTPSLKRVELEKPLAKILAVDDEQIVLDSFRKILVMQGYSMDTVETGQEALKLVQERDYDFVFTDLKMPAMNGVDVVKAVHHLKPEIDIIVITGFATIQTAVDCMKYGAVDYVEKPFTEEELIDFVKKSLIRRQDRLASKRAGSGG